MNALNEVQKMSKFERKREQILTSAAKVFDEYGVKGATLADIAEGVGLSLKSLRYYFKRKDLLVTECFLRTIGTYNALVAQAASGATPEERLSFFLHGFFKLISGLRSGPHPVLRPAFLHFGDVRALENPDTGPVAPAYANMFRGIRALILPNELLHNQDALYANKPLRLYFNARTHMMFSQLLWAVIWMERYDNDQLPRLAERMYEILIRGLAASHQSTSIKPQPLPALAESDPARVSQDAFLKAATRLINEMGYRGASVEKISAELNVTKGAFYHHNATKDGLVMECFERTFTVMRRAQHATCEQPTGFDRVLSSTAALVNFQLSDDGPLLRISALTSLEPEVRNLMIARMNNVSDRFSEILTDGMIDGSIRLTDANLAAHMVNGTINAAAELHRWARGLHMDTAYDWYVKPLFFGLFEASSLPENLIFPKEMEG